MEANIVIQRLSCKHYKKPCILLLMLMLESALSSHGFSQEINSQDDVLCGNHEDIYFSCRLAGGKIVSICAAKDTTSTTGYVQYRYGLPASLEMRFPEKIKPHRRVFKYVNASEGSVNKDILKFSNGDYTYIARQGYISGLSVIRNKDVVFRQDCKNGGHAFISRKARQVIREVEKSEEDFY